MKKILNKRRGSNSWWSVHACKIYQSTPILAMRNLQSLTQDSSVLKDCEWPPLPRRPLPGHYQSQCLLLIRQPVKHSRQKSKQSLPALSLQFLSVLVKPWAGLGGACNQYSKNTITLSQAERKHGMVSGNLASDISCKSVILNMRIGDSLMLIDDAQ